MLFESVLPALREGKRIRRTHATKYMDVVASETVWIDMQSARDINSDTARTLFDIFADDWQIEGEPETKKHEHKCQGMTPPAGIGIYLPDCTDPSCPDKPGKPVEEKPKKMVALWRPIIKLQEGYSAGYWHSSKDNFILRPDDGIIMGWQSMQVEVDE